MAVSPLILICNHNGNVDHCVFGICAMPKDQTIIKKKTNLYVVGDKLEDWVERQHQAGKRIREQFRNVVDHTACARLIAGAIQEASHPNVVEQIEGVHLRASRVDLKEKHEFKTEERRKERALRRMANLQ